MTGVPPTLALLPILVGTNLSESEVRFLFLQGFSFGGLYPGTIPSTQEVSYPSALELRIDVNSYLERVKFSDPKH